MAKLLKYVEFAKALNLSRASVTMGIKNGTIEADSETKTINIDHPVNVNYIENQKARGKTWDLNRITEKQSYTPGQVIDQPAKSKRKTKEEKKKDVADRGLYDLNLQKKKVEIEKTQKDIEFRTIQIAKEEGKLIPFDAVTNLFLFAYETCKNTYRQEIKSLANIFVERLGANHGQFVEIQKDIDEMINEITNEFKENLMAGSEGIKDEYSALAKMENINNKIGK